MNNPIQSDRPYITTTQGEVISELTKNYLAGLLRKGKLEGFRLAREWFIYTDSLEKFLLTKRKPGPKGPRKNKTSVEDDNKQN